MKNKLFLYTEILFLINILFYTIIFLIRNMSFVSFRQYILLLWIVLFSILIPVVSKTITQTEIIGYFKSILVNILVIIIPLIIAFVIISFKNNSFANKDFESLIFMKYIIFFTFIINIIFSSIGWLISKYLIKK